MSLVWCSISGHGFGHGAQLVPILNELHRRIPGLRAILRTTIPETFFRETLQLPWEHSECQQDIGCVQDGPLRIQVTKTWEAYEQFHANWEKRVMEEAKVIEAAKPNLVLSNISHLGVAAGVKADHETIALGSLSWDQVLQEYVVHGCSKQEKIIEKIRQIYRDARMLIRFSPGIPMVAFPEIKDVGPILSPAVHSQGALRRTLKMRAQDRLVLVAFGGIPATCLPLDELEAVKGYHFLISGSQDCRGYSRIASTDCVGLPFRQIFAEADIVVTKPGYATIVEAVRSHRPVVYVRRNNFADERPLVDYCHRYGQATELSIHDFETGNWVNALEKVQSLPSPIDPMPNEGTGDAVDHLMKFL